MLGQSREHIAETKNGAYRDVFTACLRNMWGYHDYNALAPR